MAARRGWTSALHPPPNWGDNPHDSVVSAVEKVSIFLFGSSVLLFARLLMRLQHPSSVETVVKGMRMRKILVSCLLVANLVRCLSLITEVASQEGFVLPPLDRFTAAQLPWLWNLVVLMPALVFLSAFSVMVLFWAQLHYTSTLMALPLLDCLFVCVNLACYLLVAAIVVTTFVLHAYNHLRIYMICIIGFLNAVVAVSFFYYGLMAVLDLKEAARKKWSGKRLVERIIVLLVVCPIGLLVRGGCYLAWGLSVKEQSQLLDLALCMSSEWLPSLAALVALNPLQQGARGRAESFNDDSTDSEPLLQEEPLSPPPRFAETPGQTWVQIYPQPEQQDA